MLQIYPRNLRLVLWSICWFVLKFVFICIIISVLKKNSVEIFFVEIIKHYYLKVWDKQDIEKK